MRVSTHVSKNDKKSHTNPSNPHKPHIISPQFLHKFTNTAFEFNNELLQRRRQKLKNLNLAFDLKPKTPATETLNFPCFFQNWFKPVIQFYVI